MKAKAARTDSATAKMQYEAAKTAAMMARDAATAAEAAYMAAKMAADGIDDDGTADAAETAQGTAETEQGKAETQAGTADTQKTAAETAETAAMTAVGTHVVGLLIAANGQDITEPVGDDSSTPAVNEAMSVAQLRAAAAGRSADAVDTAAGETDNGSGGTTAMATWPGVPDDPETDDTDESAGNVLMLQVAPEGGTALTFEHGKAIDAMTSTTTIPTTGEAACRRRPAISTGWTASRASRSRTVPPMPSSSTTRPRTMLRWPR